MDFSYEQNKKLPKKNRLELFGKDLCKVVPSLKDRLKNFEARYIAFKKYKFGIPTCGAVLLNPTMDKCLMVKGWGKQSRVSWDSPKGRWTPANRRLNARRERWRKRSVSILENISLRRTRLCFIDEDRGKKVRRRK